MEPLLTVLVSVQSEIRRRHHRQLRCIAQRADSDDLYQAVCVRAWNARASCRASCPEEIRRWVLKIAANECKSLLQWHLGVGKRSVRRTADREPYAWEATEYRDPAEAMIAAESQAQRSREAYAALRRLAPKRREAVRLRHVGQWSYERIAGRLGTTPEYSRTLASEGVRSLRAALVGCAH